MVIGVCVGLGSSRCLYKPLGWPFEGVSRIQENFRFPPLRVVRERNRLVTLVFFSLFFNKISLLPMDVGTLAEPR